MKTLLLSTLLVLGILIPVALPATVSAAPIDDACAGLSVAANGTCNKAAATASFGSIIRDIINLLSILIGSVSVIMIIIGGFRYVISNGDANAMTGAKNTILYAVVGLIVALAAQSIVQFVFTNAK